jgi:hypothetical protein
MSFLVIDYDQGCGGEYFTTICSSAPQCRSLEHRKIGTRTRVLDIFKNEFLKPNPKIQNIPKLSDLHEVIPTHRHTTTIKELLLDVLSIRITYPNEMNHHLFVIQNIIDKVLFAPQFDILDQIEFIRILTNEHNRDNFKKVKPNMQNIDIILISLGLDINEQNKKNYIKRMIDRYPRSEPNIEYDLIVNYRDLVENTTEVVKQIKSRFDIDVPYDLFKTYEKNYAEFKANKLANLIQEYR